MRELFLIFFLMLSSWAWAERRVDLSQIPPKLQQNLFKQVPRLKGDDFTLYDLDQMLRFLLNQEQYDAASVTLDSSGGHEIFKVHLGTTKRISAIKFSGFDAFSESELRQVFALAERAPFDQEGLIEAGERVRLVYKERGFHNAIVDLEFFNSSPTEIEVRIKVNEGIQTKISDVAVNSPNPRLKERLGIILNKRRGEPLTDGLLSEILKDSREFLSENKYYKSEISEPKVTLNKDESQAIVEYSVDKADEYLIEFNGLHERNSFELREALGLDSFFSTNPNIGSELANRIKSYYLGMGFARVEVRAEETETGKSYEKKLTFNVSEGPRIRIDSIQISGRFTQSPGEYTDFVRDHSSPLVKKHWYVSEDVDTGLKNLVIDRQNNGYVKAKIISSRKVYTGKDKDEVVIHINFDEGPLTIVQKINIVGNSQISEEQLRQVVGIQPQQPLRLNQLEESIQKLKQFYRESGYLEMSLQNEKEDLVSYNEDNTLAQLKFKIYEGPKVIVGSILIEGNNLTKDYVILKELEFQTGDTLTPQRLEESVRRLQRLEHFSSIDIRTLEEKTQTSQRTVVIRVQEYSPGLYNIGFGATNERNFTVRGYTGVAYRNIYGTGRGASVRLDGNYNVANIQYLERKVTLGYTEPYLLGTRNRGRVNYTQSIYVTDYVSSLDTYSATETKQTTWTLEQDISSHILLSWDALTLSHYKTFSIHDKPGFVGSSVDIGSTSLTMDVDYRDHQFTPSRGTFTRLNIEYGDPNLYSDSYIKYIRGSASFTHYIPLKPGWMWAYSLRAGHISNLNQESTGYVPYDKKGFQLGGQATMRGFSPTEAFPNKLDFNVTSDDQMHLTGSATMTLLKSEIQFPMYKTIGGAVFYDGGSVVVTGSNVSQIGPNYRHSIGVGLRISTPVGPVNLDYAWKLNMQGQDRGEDPSIFHFSIGAF